MKIDNLRADTPVARLFRADATRPMALLKQCPVYAPTPIIECPALAELQGIGSLTLKDESKRMRLGSFKALGGAFAVAQMISDAAKTADLESSAARSAAAEMTFITASAGNHGLSVAAGARVFGAQAVICLSSSVPESFAERIRSLDARVVRVEGTYEESVAKAVVLADDNNWLLLADGSWDGYLERPALVMEGYTVLAAECRDHFEASGNWPTHVFLQAGVGGLAAAVAAHIRLHWDNQPTIIVVEPEAAPCLMESIRADQITNVGGPQSNMGRLDCKDASLIAFHALKQDADIFVTITDDEALAAASLLSEHGFSTTPSGAASFAGITQIQPGADTHCLVLLTEGREEG